MNCNKSQRLFIVAAFDFEQLAIKTVVGRGAGLRLTEIKVVSPAKPPYYLFVLASCPRTGDKTFLCLRLRCILFKALS